MNVLNASLSGPAFVSSLSAAMVLSLSLIMAIGPQNVHVLRMGLQRQHVWLTVGVCVVSDVLLIGLGVFGLAQLGGLSDKLQGALVGAGVLFLAVYGWEAFRRCVWPLHQGGSTPDLSINSPQRVPPTRRQAIMSALAFSWLNPHAWLDTAVLIGTASLAYGVPNNAVFGLGAMLGSALWFVGLGVAMVWLGHRLASATLWRWLDGLVALMMWGTALWLLLGLM